MYRKSQLKLKNEVVVSSLEVSWIHRRASGDLDRLESAKELHSGLFLACPKVYEFRLQTFLSGIASFKDPYLISGWFMGSHWIREGNARRPPSLVYAVRWVRHPSACSPVLLLTISRRGVFFLLILRGNAFMEDKPSDLVQGTLDMLILKTLGLEPVHGYRIAVRLEQMSKGVFRPNAGSLFYGHSATTASWANKG
jgi:hypothetical protein